MIDLLEIAIKGAVSVSARHRYFGWIGKHVEHRRVLDAAGHQHVLLRLVAVGIDVEVDRDSAEPLADVGVDAEHATHVDVGAHFGRHAIELDVAGGGTGEHTGGDARGQCVEHVFLRRRVVPVAEGGVVGLVRERLGVAVVVADPVPLVDLLRRELELGEITVVAESADRSEHLLAGHTIDFVGHEFLLHQGAATVPFHA